MITQVTRENEAEYFRRLGQAPFFASVMHTVYASCEGRGVQCFLAGELAALQVCGQRALLCGEPEDEAELASFLSFLGVARLKTQGCCPQGFAPHALPLLRFDVRRAPPVPPVPDGLRLENEPSLLAVRCIKGLSDGAVPPDSFAVDAAARRNRGLVSAPFLRTGRLRLRRACMPCSPGRPTSALWKRRRPSAAGAVPATW